ncbi:MAG TPA: hypothetical protein VEJ87_05955 [Acidimicrobiales bacterium]|nr:hypothetical protein [Acidimicrobiales bacterium]
MKAYTGVVQFVDPSNATVDDVLEAAWPSERRRARVHLAIAVVRRVGIFISALALLCLFTRLVFGMEVPWVFFAFMTLLALQCARPGDEELVVLGREPDRRPRYRSSTGCYPRNSPS